jgi:hypothetical protein
MRSYLLKILAQSASTFTVLCSFIIEDQDISWSINQIPEKIKLVTLTYDEHPIFIVWMRLNLLFLNPFHLFSSNVIFTLKWFGGIRPRQSGASLPS